MEKTFKHTFGKGMADPRLGQMLRNEMKAHAISARQAQKLMRAGQLTLVNLFTGRDVRLSVFLRFVAMMRSQLTEQEFADFAARLVAAVNLSPTASAPALSMRRGI